MANGHTTQLFQNKSDGNILLIFNIGLLSSEMIKRNKLIHFLIL